MILILSLYIIAGAAVSILVNYLADVLPATRKLFLPVCRNCSHPFTFWEAFFSFRCPVCRKGPSKRYWIVLILGIIIPILLVFFPMKPLNFWESLPLLAFLGLVVIIDIEHKAVLIETDYAGIALGVIYGLILHKPLQMIIGGIAGAVIMTALYYFGILFNKILGNIRHQEIDEVALGLGDVFVTGYLGLIMGWPQIVGMIVIAIVLGGLFSFVYLVIKLITKKYNSFTAIPYVPFLILAGLIMFYMP